MTDFKARLSTIQRGLDEARGQAAAYADPGLSADGLQARRQELDAAARAAAAPALAALRAEVAAAALLSADSASGLLPKAGTTADATAITAAKWQQASMILAAGKPIRDVLATADIATVHAIGEYGPAFEEARTYKAPTLGEALQPGTAPDHSALRRSVDQRLAELTGKAAVDALAEARAAAGVEAFVGVHAGHLANVIAGIRTTASPIGVALNAEDAEAAARDGLPEQSPAADTAPATEGGDA